MYLVKQVEMAVRARLDGIVQQDGLTVNQYTALTVLHSHPAMTSAQLARHSFVAAQSMADLGAPLLGRGLIERRQHPTDRRRLTLSLTAAGRRVLRQREAAVARLERDMVADLDVEQVEILKAMLLACRSALEDRHESVKADPSAELSSR